MASSGRWVTSRSSCFSKIENGKSKHVTAAHVRSSQPEKPKGRDSHGRFASFEFRVSNAVDLVRRGYHANISHCPETRRQANGYSRHSRIKALPKVATPARGGLRCAEPKLTLGGSLTRSFVRIEPVCPGEPKASAGLFVLKGSKEQRRDVTFDCVKGAA